MKKLAKIKLNQLNKQELEKRDQTFLKGGYGCDCTCRCECSCNCPCGWPYGEEITSLNEDIGYNVSGDRDGSSSIMSSAPEF